MQVDTIHDVLRYERMGTDDLEWFAARIKARRQRFRRPESAWALTRFVSNEDVLAHPCGEFVLDQLQKGVPPDDLVQVLLEEYLVQTATF